MPSCVKPNKITCPVTSRNPPKRTFQHTTEDEGVKFDLRRFRFNLKFPKGHGDVEMAKRPVPLQPAARVDSGVRNTSLIGRISLKCRG